MNQNDTINGTTNDPTPTAAPLKTVALTDSQHAELIAAVEAHMKGRAKQQGITFNPVDFLMGASVFFAETSGGMGSVPASWVIGIMQGIDPVTGERPEALTDARNEARRAIEHLRNASKQHEYGDGEEKGYEALEKAISYAEKAVRMIDANIKLQEAEEAKE